MIQEWGEVGMRLGWENDPGMGWGGVGMRLKWERNPGVD